MKSEQIQIIIYRIVTFIIFIFSLLCFNIVLNGKIDTISLEIFLYVSLFSLPVTFAFFIDSLLLKYKEYSVGGNLISVYVGFFTCTLKVNGEKCDEYKSLRYFEISLTTTLEDETFIEVKVSSMLNRISVKVNNKLI